MEIRIGTRASELARWQADWTAEALRGCGYAVRIIPIQTAGDRTVKGPVPLTITAAGVPTGVFTKELQNALLAGEIDLAVHSLKDLPTDAVAGLAVRAVPRRAAVADVLVMREGFPQEVRGLADLPRGCVVGTCSLRRRAQVLALRKDLEIQGIRGNLNSRLRKLDAGEYDALLLASAGLERLGWGHRISAEIPTAEVMSAVSQGALGLETREDDSAICEAVAHLNDPQTHACVIAERQMLRALDGGCTTPIGGLCMTENGGFTLTGRVIAVDGRGMVEKTLHGPEPAALGDAVAQALLAMGAGAFIAEARRLA